MLQPAPVRRCSPAVIAISYRREDSTGITGRVYDRLQTEFGKPNVFMDFDSIPYGVDFREHIAKTLDRAKVVLVMIGPEWVGQKSKKVRRIDDPGDFVRIEVACALQRGIPIIPVLVNKAKMPTAETLPKDIAELAFRNGLILDSGIDFHHHTDRLISGIRAATGIADKKSAKPSADPEVVRRRKRMFTIAAGCAVAAACVVAIISLIKFGHSARNSSANASVVDTASTAAPATSTSPTRAPKLGTLQVNGDSRGQTFDFIDVDGEHHRVGAPGKIPNLPAGYGTMVVVPGIRTESVWINSRGVTSWIYTAAPTATPITSATWSPPPRAATSQSAPRTGKLFSGTWHGSVHEEARNASGAVTDSSDFETDVVIDSTETKWQGLTGGSVLIRNRTLSYNGYFTSHGAKQQLHATLIVHDDGITATYTKSLKPARGSGEQSFTKGTLRKVQ